MSLLLCIDAQVYHSLYSLIKTILCKTRRQREEEEDKEKKTKRRRRKREEEEKEKKKKRRRRRQREEEEEKENIKSETGNTDLIRIKRHATFTFNTCNRLEAICLEEDEDTTNVPSNVFSAFGSQAKRWSCDIFHSLLCSSLPPVIIWTECQCIYTLLKKIKGTLKQHNVTTSQSHFCEIKLST